MQIQTAIIIYIYIYIYTCTRWHPVLTSNHGLQYWILILRCTVYEWEMLRCIRRNVSCALYNSKSHLLQYKIYTSQKYKKFRLILSCSDTTEKSISYIWYVKMCEDVWSCVKLCEAVWSCVKLCEAVWSCVKLCEAVWSCVKLCEDVWRCVKMCEDVWRCVKMCEDVWRCVKMWSQILPVA